MKRISKINLQDNKEDALANVQELQSEEEEEGFTSKVNKVVVSRKLTEAGKYASMMAI